MALSIKSERADALARELAEETGESITDALTTAIEERLERERRSKRDVAGRLRSIRDGLRDTPLADARADSDILGYDRHGLPSSPRVIDIEVMPV